MERKEGRGVKERHLMSLVIAIAMDAISYLALNTIPHSVLGRREGERGGEEREGEEGKRGGGGGEEEGGQANKNKLSSIQLEMLNYIRWHCTNETS